MNQVFGIVYNKSKFKNMYTNVIKEMENMAQHSAEVSATLRKGKSRTMILQI